MKIALSGSAGTGRTTIARKLSQIVGYPSLTNLAKAILRDDGFKYGMGLPVEQFLCTPDRQGMLAENKRVMESHYDDFVTDRSWLDLAAYCVQGMLEKEKFDISEFLNECQEEVEKYDIIIHIPWGRQPLESNGTRTIDPWFQFIIDSIICRLAMLWDVKLISVPSNLDNNETLEWIVNHLKEMDSDLTFQDIVLNNEIDENIQ